MFFVFVLLWFSSGLAYAEYILRLPNLPEMRFRDVEIENIKFPFSIGNIGRHGFDWTQRIKAHDPKSKEDDRGLNKEEFGKMLSRIWSRVYFRESVRVEFELLHFVPDFSHSDHKMIFYTAHAGVLVVNGKEIIFPYFQAMIDKAHLGFIEPYRHCFRDITPHEWPLDEPRVYGSIPLKIRGVLDRLETDEPFLWEGRVDSVRFMDVYLRDIEILKIDCKPRH